eukprot:GHVS01034441.1.p1 GENE.GHVS01034441.1~~GHVS01034441.1.p1  ORF type:complete len:338 (-),score=34.32 GHVS01034441.1:295-1308(-)
MNVDESVYPRKKRPAAEGEDEVNVYTGFCGEFRLNGQDITAVVYGRRRTLPLKVGDKVTELIPEQNESLVEKLYNCYNWPMPPKYEDNQYTWREKSQAYGDLYKEFRRLTFHVKNGTDKTGDDSQPIAEGDGDVCEVHVKLKDKDVYGWLGRNKGQYTLFFEAHCFGENRNRFVVTHQCEKCDIGLCSFYRWVGKTTDADTPTNSPADDEPKKTKRSAEKTSETSMKRKQTTVGKSVNDGETPSKKTRTERDIFMEKVKELENSDGHMALKFDIKRSDVSVEAVGVIATNETSRYELIVKDSAAKSMVDQWVESHGKRTPYFKHFVSLPPWQDPPKE